MLTEGKTDSGSEEMPTEGKVDSGSEEMLTEDEADSGSEGMQPHTQNVAETQDMSDLQGEAKTQDILDFEEEAKTRDILDFEEEAKTRDIQDFQGETKKQDMPNSCSEAEEPEKISQQAADMKCEKCCDVDVVLELLQKRQPFLTPQNSDFARCVRIMPCDVVRLQQEGYQAGRSSFLQHAFYQYRHLLLAVTPAGEYVLGVPGIQNPQERYMAEMFGYRDFRLPHIRGRPDFWVLVPEPLQRVERAVPFRFRAAQHLEFWAVLFQESDAVPEQKMGRTGDPPKAPQDNHENFECNNSHNRRAYPEFLESLNHRGVLLRLWYEIHMESNSFLKVQRSVLFLREGLRLFARIVRRPLHNVQIRLLCP